MMCMIALDIQVSLRNPTAMLEDSMTSEKTLYSVRMIHKMILASRRLMKLKTELNSWQHKMLGYLKRKKEHI